MSSTVRHTFGDAIQKLESRGIMPIKAPDLKRMKEAVELIGYFDWPFFKAFQKDPKKVIVVAGTNGKGTTSAALSRLLTAAGERVGFYSSPHLVNYTERIRINNEPISETLFIQAFEAVTGLAPSLELTHFEIITLMALWVFAADSHPVPVDRIILEVGLGGTWDATNAVPHGAVVITTLGLDHQNLLGNTLSSIAENKLGTVWEGPQPYETMVTHAPWPAEILNVVTEKKKKTSARWIERKSFEYRAKAGHPPIFELSTPWGPCPMPLPGERAAENIVLALTTFESLGYQPKLFMKSLLSLQWPGRMQEIPSSKKDVQVFVSGDHNLQGIESLLELLKFYERRKISFVVGIGRDKNYGEMLEKLSGVPQSQIYLTETPFKGLKVEEYGDWLKKTKGAFSSPVLTLQTALDHSEAGDLIVVTGSLYLVGALLAHLR